MRAVLLELEELILPEMKEVGLPEVEDVCLQDVEDVGIPGGEESAFQILQSSQMKTAKALAKRKIITLSEGDTIYPISKQQNAGQHRTSKRTSRPKTTDFTSRAFS